MFQIGKRFLMVFINKTTRKCEKKMRVLSFESQNHHNHRRICPRLSRVIYNRHRHRNRYFSLSPLSLSFLLENVTIQKYR